MELILLQRTQGVGRTCWKCLATCQAKGGLKGCCSGGHSVWVLSSLLFRDLSTHHHLLSGLSLRASRLESCRGSISAAWTEHQLSASSVLSPGCVSEGKGMLAVKSHRITQSHTIPQASHKRLVVEGSRGWLPLPQRAEGRQALCVASWDRQRSFPGWELVGFQVLSLGRAQ